MKKYLLFALALTLSTSAFALTPKEMEACGNRDEAKELNSTFQRSTSRAIEILDPETSQQLLVKLGAKLNKITGEAETCDAALEELKNLKISFDHVLLQSEAAIQQEKAAIQTAIDQF